MPISINDRPAAALQALARAQSAGASAIRRLASGQRINSAADDAAGLAISVHLSSQIAGLNMAARNALDAISMTQTAEAGLGSITDNLQRLRELAVQAANAGNSASDRAALQVEAASLVDEVDRVARSTRFNGQNLLDGSFGAASFQVGAGVGQTIQLGAQGSVRAAALGVVQPPPPPAVTALAGATLSAASTITGPGQLVINGVDVWRGNASGADARDLAAAVNAAGIPGVNMAAAPNVLVGTWSAGPTDGSMTVDGNGGLYYSFSYLDEASELQTVEMIFNLPYFAPELSATNTGTGITLTRADGGNVALNFTLGSPEVLGLGGLAYGVNHDGINYGHDVLSYNTAAGLTIGGSKAIALGLTAGTIDPYVPPSGGMLDALSLSTVAGANDALVTLDACLRQVDAQRAALGAAQNRFAAAVTQTRDASTQASAARSRIVDADYADESASLIRSTILQAAGTAMVAQANQRRSDVLRLLKG